MSFAALSLLPSEAAKDENLANLLPIDPVLNATFPTTSHLHQALQ